MKRVLQLGCLAALLMAVPQSGVAQSRGLGTIVLPLEKLSNGLLLVEMRVNGKPAWLVLDTASEMTVLDNDLLGLSLRDLQSATARLARQDGVRPSVLLRATLSIGPDGSGLRLVNQRVAASDLDGISKTLGRRIDGILGVDVLGKFAEVAIRWRARQLVLVLEEGKDENR